MYDSRGVRGYKEETRLLELTDVPCLIFMISSISSKMAKTTSLYRGGKASLDSIGMGYVPPI